MINNILLSKICLLPNTTDVTVKNQHNPKQTRTPMLSEIGITLAGLNTETFFNTVIILMTTLTVHSHMSLVTLMSLNDHWFQDLPS